jgi:hypothetical protein
MLGIQKNRSKCYSYVMKEINHLIDLDVCGRIVLILI